MSISCAEAVTEYFAALRAMDPDRWTAAFAPDAVSHDPVGTPPHQGHEAHHAFLSGMCRMFQTIDLTENDVFINGQSAAVKWTGKAVAKSGRSANFEGVDVIDCNDAGKIVQVRAFWDPRPVMAIVRS